jgi:hypothetical protein
MKREKIMENQEFLDATTKIKEIISWGGDDYVR